MTTGEIERILQRIDRADAAREAARSETAKDRERMIRIEMTMCQVLEQSIKTNGRLQGVEGDVDKLERFRDQAAAEIRQRRRWGTLSASMLGMLLTALEIYQITR